MGKYIEDEIKLFFGSVNQIYLIKDEVLSELLSILKNYHTKQELPSYALKNEINQYYLNIPKLGDKRLRKEFINNETRRTLGAPKKHINFNSKEENETRISDAEAQYYLKISKNNGYLEKTRITVPAVKNSLGEYSIGSLIKNNFFDGDLITKVNDISLEKNPLFIIEAEGKKIVQKWAKKNPLDYNNIVSNKKICSLEEKSLHQLIELLGQTYSSNLEYYGEVTFFFKDYFDVPSHLKDKEQSGKYEKNHT